MGCCGSTANVPEDSQPTRNVSGAGQIPMQVRAQVPMPTPPRYPLDMPSRHRAISAPQQVKPAKPSSSQHSQHSSEPRKRANTLDGPRASRSTPRPGSRVSTMRQVLSTGNHSKFRILVVGKQGSGKSSLINAVFKVDILAAKRTASIFPDINNGIHPIDNRYLIFHEYIGFEPGDVQGLQAIRKFILYRTEPGRPAAEKLHAVWICIPTSDVIGGSVGEGVEEILTMLTMRRVPVVVAFTKFDVIILTEGRNVRDHASARAKAYARYKQSCLSLFDRDPIDIPAKIVQVNSQLGDRVHNLVVTTDRLIMGLASTSISSSERRAETSISPVRLVWSAALRAYHDINVEASIEVGRNRYWRDLRSGHNFVGQSLKDCIDVVHVDIIEVWNLNDRTSYLSSTEFKERLTHVVEDLAGPTGDTLMSGPSVKFSGWIDGFYKASQQNVRCLMGYIVDLIVILGDISRTTGGYVSTIDALGALDRHVEQGWRDEIHQDIYRFVTETFMTSSNAVPQRDLVLEKIIALIQQYCPHPFPEADAERDAELVAVPVQEVAAQEEEITLIISVG